MHRTVTTVTPGRRSGLREFGSTCRVDATGVLYITPTLTKSPGARAPGARCRAGLMVYSSNQCELYICQFERMRVKTLGVFLSRVRQQHSLFPPLLPLPFRHRKITAVFRLLDWCRCAVALTPRRSMQRLWCRLWVMAESDLSDPLQRLPSLDTSLAALHCHIHTSGFCAHTRQHQGASLT